MITASISTELGAPRFGHAWRTHAGDARATVRFGTGMSDLTFTGPGDARELAAACLAAADAMDTLPAAEGGQQ